MPRKRKQSKTPVEQFAAVPFYVLALLQAGKITFLGLTIYAILLRQMNWQTGMWHGSASKIVWGIGDQVGDRTVQMKFTELQAAGLVKSFYKPGSRLDYFIAIDKFHIRVGGCKGSTLDAFATQNPREPVYVDSKRLLWGSAKPGSVNGVDERTGIRCEPAISEISPHPIAGNRHSSTIIINPNPYSARGWSFSAGIFRSSQTSPATIAE
jgi:hypothetical protein